MGDEWNGCGDTNCQIRIGPREGLCTNGGCRCLRDLPVRERIATSRKLQSNASEIATLRAQLEEAQRKIELITVNREYWRQSYWGVWEDRDGLDLTKSLLENELVEAQEKNATLETRLRELEPLAALGAAHTPGFYGPGCIDCGAPMTDDGEGTPICTNCGTSEEDAAMSQTAESGEEQP